MEWRSFWLSGDMVRMSMHHASEDRSSVSCHFCITWVIEVTPSTTAAVWPCHISETQTFSTIRIEVEV